MQCDTLIIGTGPAGLAMAGQLRNQNLPFEILDQSDKVGASWHGHYDRLHLHTVKKWSHLPHCPFPDHYPEFVPKNLLIEYFNDYVDRFDIQPHYGQEVTHIERNNGTWKVSVKGNEDWIVNHLVIATGTNRSVVVPSWPGEESFTGEMVHSRWYKNPKPFMDKRVLVVGMGNTGAEIALDLSESGITTFISVRGEVSVVPRDINGRSIQVTSKQLAKLPFNIGDWIGTQIRKIYFGNLEKHGLKISKMHPAVQLRTTGKTPVLDIGTIAAIKKGAIKVVSEVSHFEGSSVSLVDGTSIDVDAVILATGYSPSIEEFLPAVTSILDQNSYPSQVVGDNELKGLYFVGYDGYKLGGILGTIVDQSEMIAKAIAMAD